MGCGASTAEPAAPTTTSVPARPATDPHRLVDTDSILSTVVTSASVVVEVKRLDAVRKKVVYSADVICLAPGWIKYTALGRHTQRIDSLLAQNTKLAKTAADSVQFETTLLAVVRKAYRLSSSAAARSQTDMMGGQNIFSTINGLRQWCGSEQKRRRLGHALHEILALEHPDGLVAKLSEVCDRAPRCPSAKKQAFNLIIHHAGKLCDARQHEHDKRSGERESANLSRLRHELGISDGVAKEDVVAQAVALLGITFGVGQDALAECWQAVFGSRLDSGVGAAAAGGLDTREGALERLFAVFGDYLDEHKERAWKSAFEEPARFYFNCVGDGSGRDHVNVHGINWYLTLLQTGLGFAMPTVADQSDAHSIGVVDFWAGLSSQAWACFSDPNNFGKDFGGIRELRGGGTRWVAKRVASGQFPHGDGDVNPPSRLAERIGQSGSSSSKRLRIYADRFAHFFTQTFFVRKAFEALHSELKPEHSGFRHAAATLFSEYAEAHGLEEATLVEHVYDDMMLELDVERIARFFGWCGLLRLTAAQHAKLVSLKAAADVARRSSLEAATSDFQSAAAAGLDAAASASSSASASPASSASSASVASPFSSIFSTLCLPAANDDDDDDDPRTCPICFQRTGDVTPIEHLEPGVGDVSSHRMCEACRRAWKHNVCPFCKEVTTAAELVGFIQSFIRTVASSTGDPNTSAAVLETIQLFEMEHEAEPAVIRRVYKMIAEDDELGRKIDEALKSAQQWPRDMAGVFWRLHCAAEANELRGLSAAARKRLAKVVDAIWRPFERGSGQPHDLDPHFHGALYSQALVAWLCAWRSGMATDGLVGVVQRCGRNLVRWKQTTKQHKANHGWKRVRERIHAEYLALSHEPIWGSREKDIVWAAFFK